MRKKKKKKVLLAETKCRAAPCPKGHACYNAKWDTDNADCICVRTESVDSVRLQKMQ